MGGTARAGGRRRPYRRQGVLMGRDLDELAPQFFPLACQFLARLTEAGVHVCIISTGRTQEEQDRAVRTGYSRVSHSRHQDGMAIDVCPYQMWQLHGADKLQWDTLDPVWWTIGRIGESLGLRWGGRFTPVNSQGLGWDPGHFEIPHSLTERRV